MSHLHVRCPSCAKLYQIDVSTIFSATPHFRCMGCATQFEFDFPQETPGMVQARRVVPPAAKMIEPQRKCPKCGVQNAKSAKECTSCQVIFEKLERMPGGALLRTQPSLARLWKELLENYTDEEQHQKFIMACRELDAMEFAYLKYQDIAKAQGQDEIAREMLIRIRAVISVAGSTVNQAPPSEASVKSATRKAKWLQAAGLSPFVISLLLILWGLSHAGPRNMVGAGIAIALLSYGLMTGFLGQKGFRELLRF